VAAQLSLKLLVLAVNALKRHLGQVIIWDPGRFAGWLKEHEHVKLSPAHRRGVQACLLSNSREGR